MSTSPCVKIFFLICIVSSQCFAQPLFNRGYQYGSQWFQLGNLRLFQLPGGGYFLYGGGDAAGYTSGFLGKLNNNGTLLWANDYRYSYFEVPTFESAIADTDNNVVFAAADPGGDYGNVIKSDTLGNFLWTLRFPFVIKKVLLSDDGNYFAIGSNWTDIGVNDWDINVYKIAPDGTVLWGRHYWNDDAWTPFNIYNKYIYDGAMTPTGEFLILFDLQGTTKWVMKMSTYGTVMWLKEYYTGNNWAGPGWKILVLNDGNYLVCGRDRSAPPNHELSAFKINTDGDVLWSKKYSYNGNASLINAFQLTDHNVVLFGSYSDSNYTNGGTAVLMLDTVGHLLSSFQIRTDYGFYPMWLGLTATNRAAIIESASGSHDTTQVMMLDAELYATCAYDSAINFTEADDNIVVSDSLHMVFDTTVTPDTTPLISTPRVMFDEDLCQTTNSSQPANNPGLQVFPVPVSDIIEISAQQPFENASLQLVNAIGQKVYQGEWKVSQLNAVLDVSQLPEGIYWVVIKMESVMSTKKVVIQR